MKLYDFGPAVNAQRVRVFLAEKGLEVPTEQLNVRDGNQFVEPFTSMNPFHCVPFLELDDGTVIAESMSICRYLEELHPEPPLFGATAQERAGVDMWQRRFELDGFMPLLHAVRNHVPMFAGRVVPGTRTDLPPAPGDGEPWQGDDGGLPRSPRAAHGRDRVRRRAEAQRRGHHRLLRPSHGDDAGDGHRRVLARHRRVVRPGVGAAGLRALRRRT